MFKIKKFYSSYSKKKGTVQKSCIIEKNIQTFDEAVDLIKHRAVSDAEVNVSGNAVSVRWFSSSGVPTVENYLITKQSKPIIN